MVPQYFGREVIYLQPYPSPCTKCRRRAVRRGCHQSAATQEILDSWAQHIWDLLLGVISELGSICSLLLEYQDMTNIYQCKREKENYYSQSLRPQFNNIFHITLSFHK